jgi:hypothetical protein
MRRTPSKLQRAHNQRERAQTLRRPRSVPVELLQLKSSNAQVAKAQVPTACFVRATRHE